MLPPAALPLGESLGSAALLLRPAPTSDCEEPPPNAADRRCRRCLNLWKALGDGACAAQQGKRPEVDALAERALVVGWVPGARVLALKPGKERPGMPLGGWLLPHACHCWPPGFQTVQTGLQIASPGLQP